MLMQPLTEQVPVLERLDISHTDLRRNQQHKMFTSVLKQFRNLTELIAIGNDFDWRSITVNAFQAFNELNEPIVSTGDGSC
jgi:ubiquinone/menaquinone biosynthesis C-methylase UbiE